MSAKWEFGQKGPKQDPYADILLAAQEARIRFDLLASLKREYGDGPNTDYLRNMLEKDLAFFREEIRALMSLLGA